MESGTYFFFLAIVPVLGIAAQWLAWRLRLPSILLLLGFGVILGQFVRPDEVLAQLVEGAPADAELLAARLLFPLVSLSVAVILFEGGLSLRLHELKAAGRGVFRLVTIGVLVSWILTTLAAWQFLKLDLRISALLGAVLVVTGPTVVAPLLRHIRPVGRVASLLKWEGIVIDPIGAVLAVIVFEEILAHGLAASPAEMGWILAKTALIGALLGTGSALLLVHFVMRYWIPDFLHAVVFLSVALGVFFASNLLQEESGLVTVTVMGIVLANQKAISVRHVVEFKEHLGVFLISCLFIVLGARLRPAELADLGWGGIVFLALLILVVRPASVYLSMIGTSLTWRERTFLAFLAPRGIVAAAVTSVFALKVVTLASANPELGATGAQAEKLVPITFLVILGTVAIYGLLASPLAKLLGLSDTNPQGILFAGGDKWIRDLAKMILESGQQVMLIDTNYGHVAAAKMDGIPAECASVLSEEVREELELFGIGRLLAMTPNDEVNALACREFAHVFGRANVYQLSPWDEQSGRRTSVAEHLRGRLLFCKGCHHEELAERYHSGAVLKKTKLTDEFGPEDFRALYGESALVMFIFDENKKLKVRTAGDTAIPAGSTSIIALVKNGSAETEPG